MQMSEEIGRQAVTSFVTTLHRFETTFTLTYRINLRNTGRTSVSFDLLFQRIWLRNEG